MLMEETELQPEISFAQHTRVFKVGSHPCCQTLLTFLRSHLMFLLCCPAKQAEKMVASEEAKRRLLVSSFRESGILAQGRWSWRHQNWFFSWGFPLILHLQMKHIVFSRDVGTQSARVAFRVLYYQVGLGTGGNDQTIENSYSSRTSEWKHVQEFGLDPHLH